MKLVMCELELLRTVSATLSATDSLVFRGGLEKLEVLHRRSGRSAPIIDEAGRKRIVPALSLVIYK